MSRKSSAVNSNACFGLSSSKALCIHFWNMQFLDHLCTCLFVHGMPYVQFLKAVHGKSLVNDSGAFKNGSYAGVSAAGIAQPVKKKKKRTNLPVILLKRNSQRDWMKGESLFRMAAFGWSAAWKPSGRDQERPPHVILIQRLVETAQTLIQMQPQGIHFPPQLNANFSKMLVFFFSAPSLNNSMAFLGSNTSKYKQFQNKYSLCVSLNLEYIMRLKTAKSHHCKNTNKYQNTT